MKERGNDVGRADFARLQRETLENYLIGLIRAVVRRLAHSCCTSADDVPDVPSCREPLGRLP